MTDGCYPFSLLWLKYVHVTVDTYSRFIHASPLSGEALCDVITHTLQCMTAMGKPQIIKTDNGPGYTGTKFQQFCSQFDIKHVSVIAYNPQGHHRSSPSDFKKYASAID